MGARNQWDPHPWGPPQRGSHSMGPHSRGLPLKLAPTHTSPHARGNVLKEPHSRGATQGGPHLRGPLSRGLLLNGAPTQAAHSRVPHSRGPSLKGAHSRGSHSRGPTLKGARTQGGPHTWWPLLQKSPIQEVFHSKGPHSRYFFETYLKKLDDCSIGFLILMQIVVSKNETNVGK
jgi:hypothetical protein